MYILLQLIIYQFIIYKYISYIIIYLYDYTHLATGGRHKQMHRTQAWPNCWLNFRHSITHSYKHILQQVHKYTQQDNERLTFRTVGYIEDSKCYASRCRRKKPSRKFKLMNLAFKQEEHDMPSSKMAPAGFQKHTEQIPQSFCW